MAVYPRPFSGYFFLSNPAIYNIRKKESFLNTLYFYFFLDSRGDSRYLRSQYGNCPP